MSRRVYDDSMIHVSEAQGRVLVQKTYDEDKYLTLTKQQLRDVWRRYERMTRNTDVEYKWEISYTLYNGNDVHKHEVCADKHLTACVVAVDEIVKKTPGAKEDDVEIISLTRKDKVKALGTPITPQSSEEKYDLFTKGGLDDCLGIKHRDWIENADKDDELDAFEKEMFDDEP